MSLCRSLNFPLLACPFSCALARPISPFPVSACHPGLAQHPRPLRITYAPLIASHACAPITSHTDLRSSNNNTAIRCQSTFGLIFPVSIPAEGGFERVTWLLSQEHRQSNAIGRSLCRRTYGCTDTLSSNFLATFLVLLRPRLDVWN